MTTAAKIIARLRERRDCAKRNLDARLADGRGWDVEDAVRASLVSAGLEAWGCAVADAEYVASQSTDDFTRGVEFALKAFEECAEAHHLGALMVRERRDEWMKKNDHHARIVEMIQRLAGEVREAAKEEATRG